MSQREVHTATVTDNNDPEQRFRIKVACATLMGTDTEGEATEYGDWVDPVFPALFTTDGKATGGFFAVPGIGAAVELELASSSAFDQSPGQTSINAPSPRWRACIFRKSDDIPEEFAANYPNRFGFRSASGHVFYIDQSPEGKGKIVFAGKPNDEGAQSLISINDDGSIQIATNTGQLISLNSEKSELTILDGNKQAIYMKPDGITIAGAGGRVSIGNAGIDIVSKGNVYIQGGSVTLAGGKIALGSVAAAIPLAKGDLTPSAKVFTDV